MHGSLQVGPVREVSPERLSLWSGNPRRIAPDRFEDLKRVLASDREMLRARPLVALPDGTVVMGNQRLRAIWELGWGTVPVLVVDLEPARARLWALRDNNVWGEWDEASLGELLAELAGEGVDVLLTGFESTDLDRLLSGLQLAKEPDDAPSLPIGEPDSRPGQRYWLGRHCVMCGDATDPEQLRKLVADAEAEVFWTDPPYGSRYQGKTRDRLTIANDDPDGLLQLLTQAFTAADRVMAPSARFYVCAPAGPQGTDFRLALRSVGWHFHQSLSWVKSSIVVGHSDHHFQHEDVLYGWKPGPGRPGRGRHQGSKWFGGNDQSSVFFVDRPARSSEHPTMKPIALIEAQLRNSSRRGDIVLDPFAGSGSTLIACERLGRRCYAMEIDPRYVDVIRNRYQEYVDGNS